MRLRTITILAGLALSAASPALAWDGGVTKAHGTHSRAYGAQFGEARYGGFAQPFIEGEYIGAPFTAVPRPNHLVPTPWSYGTYGIPTVSGIAAPPVGAPQLTVIHAPGPRKGMRRTSAASAVEPAGVQVVNVSVSRR